MNHFFFIFAAIFLASVAVEAQSAPQPGKPTTPTKITAAKKETVFKAHEILDKPQPGYTERARSTSTQGVVHLKVELLPNGTIGTVRPMTYLAHGLTDRAIEAAKRIKFSPRTINGEPVLTEVDIYYTFSVHYDDVDPDVSKKVEILSAPKPAITAAELPASSGGKISVEVFFGADRRVKVFKPVADLTDDQAKRLETAVAAIKFRPAVHKNGKRVNVTKVVVYEIGK